MGDMAAARRPLRLTRSMRFQRGGEFAQVRQQGKRLTNGCLVVNWKVLPNDASSRIGIITSRRVGSAVIRSRARRLLREAFRLHQHDLCHPVMLVLVARPSIAGKPLAVVERDFLCALRNARLLSDP
jgi:ribonuclease P protein component